jgi:hypothetical protein
MQDDVQQLQGGRLTRLQSHDQPHTAMHTSLATLHQNHSNVRHCLGGLCAAVAVLKTPRHPRFELLLLLLPHLLSDAAAGKVARLPTCRLMTTVPGVKALLLPKQLSKGTPCRCAAHDVSNPGSIAVLVPPVQEQARSVNTPELLHLTCHRQHDEATINAAILPANTHHR